MIIPFSNPRRKQLRRGGARADLVMSGIVANNSERNRATLGAKPMRRGIHERQADHAETLLRNDDFFGVITVLGILPSFMMCRPTVEGAKRRLWAARDSYHLEGSQCWSL